MNIATRITINIPAKQLKVNDLVINMDGTHFILTSVVLVDGRVRTSGTHSRTYAVKHFDCGPDTMMGVLRLT